MNRLSTKFSEAEYEPWRVGLSMNASWAMGVSMAAGISIMMSWGFQAFLIWMVANIATLPIFAFAYSYLPEVRHIVNFRIAQLVMLFVLITQVSLNQQALYELMGGGVQLVTYQFMPNTAAMAVTIAIGSGLMLFIYKYGLPGSITTDVLQYAGMIAGALGIIVLGLLWGTSGVSFPSPTVESYQWALTSGAIGLLSGPYVDATQWQRLERAPEPRTGVWAGLFFGIYMLCVLGAGLVLDASSLPMALLFLLTVASVSTSTIDSIAAGLQRLLGNKKLALVVGLGASMGWPLLMNVGLTDLWSLFVSIRAVVVGALLTIVVLVHYIPRLEMEDLKTRWDEDAPQIVSDEAVEVTKGGPADD